MSKHNDLWLEFNALAKQREYDKRYDDAGEALALCGSPIEASMLFALGVSATDRGMDFSAAPLVSEVGADRYLKVEQQKEIGPYRADFLCTLLAWPVCVESSIVVECDGHDYHERTKEQAAHDKKRDRFMVARGYRVFRYTGSEIYKDAVRCADEVLDILGTSVTDKVAERETA